MLKFGNKEFRNLQEQVEKNMDDIKEILQGQAVLNEFGIKVLGQVDTEEDLPESAEEFGDAYAVGTESPYELYVWTRNMFEEEPGWFNIGEFPKPGPQGPQGIQGEQGETGLIALESRSIYESYDPTVGSNISLLFPNFNRTPVVGDRFLALWHNSTSNSVYLVSLRIVSVSTNTASAIVLAVSTELHGPQGAQGADGQDGEQGPQGPKGDKGDRGDAGGFINIRGILDSEDDLPDPATLRNLTIAYLVGDDEDLYIQVGESSETALWTNTGPLNAGTLVYVNGIAQNTWNSDVKLDKVTTTGVNPKVYTVDTQGSQSMTNVARWVVQANAIPVYTAGGSIKITGTFNNDDAASKKYVDDAIADIDAGVTSVNSKTGAVTLTASDINASNSQSIQTNLERLDERIDDYAEDNIEGSDTIVFDLNEQGDKYQISIDQDVLDTISGKLNATKSAVATVGGLVIPSATPTEDLLVGIDTTNGQQNITIGSGLTLVNGELSATGASSTWGSITGTITNQTDLVSYVSTAISTAIGDAIGGNY